MRRFLALIGLAALWLLSPGPPPLALAAEPPRLSEAHLALWPEYDDPSLLVIVAGSLPQDTPLPATLRLLIPSGAVLNAAAYVGEAGTLVHAKASRKAAATAGWDEVSFEASNPVFQFEYYHNAIKGGPDKSVSFDYRFLYPIDELTVEVQQPLRSANFVTKPETQSVLIGERGFRYYQFKFSKVEAGRGLPLEIAYTKADSEPSVPPQVPEAPLAPAPAETGPNWTTIGLIGGGVAVFAAFLWVVVRRRAEPVEARRQAEMAPAPVRPRPRLSAAGAAPTAAQQRRGAAGAPQPRANFCPHCGEQLGQRVNFCPHCGERVG